MLLALRTGLRLRNTHSLCFQEEDGQTPVVIGYGFETNEDFSYLCNEVIGKKAFAIEFHTWSNRYYISNTDGSHRIAALYRQNHEQNRGVMLRLPLFERYLDKRLMTDLLSWFHILITTESAAIHIRGVLKELGLGCLFCGGVEDK
jgi:hypothetical protein